MSEVVAFRMDEDLRRAIRNLSKEEESDQSTIIRQLLLRGYREIAKEKAAQAYKEGKITLSEAARRTSLTLWEMEEYLVQKGFVSSYSVDDLERELKLMR